MDDLHLVSRTVSFSGLPSLRICFSLFNLFFSSFKTRVLDLAAVTYWAVFLPVVFCEAPKIDFHSLERALQNALDSTVLPQLVSFSHPPHSGLAISRAALKQWDSFYQEASLCQVRLVLPRQTKQSSSQWALLDWGGKIQHAAPFWSGYFRLFIFLPQLLWWLPKGQRFRTLVCWRPKQSDSVVTNSACLFFLWDENCLNMKFKTWKARQL